MQHNNAGKKKRIITATCAAALTVSIVGTALYHDSSVALARPSLPGVEKIVSENSNQKPFKILEIVDSYSAARIGYTVAGEEPGYFNDDNPEPLNDPNMSQAISDMASKAERADRYRKGDAHDPSSTTPYTDLVDKAFSYTNYNEVVYNETDTEQINGKSYGSFVKNGTAGNSFYEENSAVEDDFDMVYVPGDPNGDNTHKTIQDVYDRVSGTDGSGLFYVHNVLFGAVEPTAKDANKKYYTITEYKEIYDDIKWKQPFNLGQIAGGIYSNEVFDTDHYTAPLQYVYDPNWYTFNGVGAELVTEDPSNTPEDPTDDVTSYRFTTDEPFSVGDQVYKCTSDANGDVLSIYGTVIKEDLDGDATTEELGIELYSDGTKILLEGEESLASLAKNTYSGDSFGLVDDNGAENDPKTFYISGLQVEANGIYEAYTKFNSVNNADDAPSAAHVGTDPDTDTGYHQWFYKKGSEDPYKYIDAHTGDYDYIHDYTGPVVNEYYYKGGYTNNEWFKKEVLDVDGKDCGNICIDVVTKRLDKVTAEDIQNADLVYFTYGGDNTSYYAADIDYAAAKAILQGVTASENPLPVVLNLKSVLYGAYNMGDTTKYFDNNVKTMMSLLLLDESRYAGIANYLDDASFKTIEETDPNIGKPFLEQYQNKTNDLSHVTRTVFVNDDVRCHDAVYGDFTTAYTSEKVNGFSIQHSVNGTHKYNFDFKDVKEDIDSELFYFQVAGKDVSKFVSTISKATCIRHILNYGDRRTVGKAKLRVLDLEPYYSRDVERTNNPQDVLGKIYWYNNQNSKVEDLTISGTLIRDIFDKNWLTQNVSNSTSPENIQVTGMGTKEFIGRIEDLNENYDLIYIGMDTAYLNTRIDNKRKTDVVVSNDNKHYVYRHTGDDVQVNGMTGITNWSHHNLSGDDITPDKYNELINYIDAGYAVILSDEFFNKNGNGSIALNTNGTPAINENRVDPNSLMYKFVRYCTTEKNGNNFKYLYKNVNISSNFENNTYAPIGGSVADHRTEFVRYLNISKLELEVIKMPLLYNPYEKDENASNKPVENGNLVHYYLGMNAWGEYALEFEVRLNNDAAVDTTNTSYDCKLYIDHDADGRYETVEALDSIEILNENNDVQNPGDDGKFHLTTGTTYKISRRVPEGYVGLIPWKLVFIENRNDGNELIKTAIQDYSAINDNLNKPTIKIIQLTSDGNPNTGRGTNDNHLDLRDDAVLNQLYDQVIDFNISVDKDTVTNFVNEAGAIFGGGVDRLEKLYDYDMLVMGFTDVYNFRSNDLAKSKEAVLAVRQFMLSGKSILFTHDLTSSRIEEAENREWGVLANRYLRDIQGMDRYGIVGKPLETTDLYYKGQLIDKYVSKYDETRPANPDGLSDSALLRHNQATYGEIDAKYTRNITSTHDGLNERELTTVARLNRGQVTEYPFRIGELEQDVAKYGDDKWHSSEYITTAKTHHQYFQLDMETDYTDTNYDDDIVVWYTISLPGTSKANYHKLNYNDARNNYYIYNKGNITYTGAGHSFIEGKPEKELFVNTLVAAYNAGTHAPYAAYKNSSKLRASDITSQYLPYDISLKNDTSVNNGWLEGDDTTVTVYFKAVNNNLQDNLRDIVAQYYVEVPNGTAGALKVGSKSFKIITPVEAKDCTLNAPLTDSQILTNGHTYEFKYRVADLMNGNLQGVNSRYHAVIYTRMRAQTKNKTIDDDKRDLASTQELTVLPANDSFKPLNINFTQLYDLK